LEIFVRGTLIYTALLGLLRTFGPGLKRLAA
jgi:hypothetical protein